MRLTLVSDGSSDRALIPILEWVLRQAGVTDDLQSQWADFRNLRNPPKGLSQKISLAIKLFPCDLLFIHRDAEGEPWHVREMEIQNAVAQLASSEFSVPWICVIPVRMLEAWLLIDSAAIREAAANPNGNVALNMPKVNKLENIPDPKEVLFELLRVASQLSGRRLRKLSLPLGRARVAEVISDYSPLRALPAFVTLEATVSDFVTSRHE